MRAGCELEEPPVLIPWGVRPAEVRRLLGGGTGEECGARFVTDGYYVTRCKALGGLSTRLGLHFRPRSEDGVLTELEFFDNGVADLPGSYSLYQRHLEGVFGTPARTRAGTVSPELAWHEWREGRVRVSHWVMDRFGPEQHVRIVRQSWLARLLT